VANAGVKGRPIAPVSAESAGTSVLERQVRRHRGRYLSGAAPSYAVQMVCQASSWLLNSAFTNTPLASGAIDF
jgi:hypothetical protein